MSKKTDPSKGQNAVPKSGSAPFGQTGKGAPQDSAGSDKDEKLNLSPGQNPEDIWRESEGEEDLEDDTDIESVLNMVREEDFRKEADVLFFRDFLRQSGAQQMDFDPEIENPAVLKSVAIVSAMAALEPGLKANPMHWNNREELYSSFQKLAAIGAAEETKDFQTAFVYAGVCFALERYADARDAFRQLDKIKADDKGHRSTADVMERFVSRALSVPMFMNNYITRGNAAWKTVLEKGPDVLKAMQKESDGTKQLAMLCDMLQTFLSNSGLSAMTAPLDFEDAVQSPEAKVPICFNTEDLDLDFFPIQFTISLMPDALKDRWEPQIGGSSILKGAIKDADGGTIRIRVSDTPQHLGADIQVYNKTLLQPDLRTRDLAQRFIKVFTSMLLGDLAAAVNIHSITFSETRFQRRTSHSLLELPELLDELGYSPEVSAQDYIRKLHHTYLHKPVSASKLLRADISSGWTECGRLVDEYEQGSEDAFVHFLDMGVAAVFVAWPNSIMDCPEAEFVQRLTDFVDEAEGEGNYTLIGQASGTKNCYLDMLVYCMPVLIRALEAFFRTIPGGSNARLQAFRRASAPVPIQFSKISEGMIEVSSGFKPSTKANSSSQKKGSKGKGKGKGKRGKK